MTDPTTQLILSIVGGAAGAALVLGTIAAVRLRERDVRDQKNKKPGRRMMVAEGDYAGVEPQEDSLAVRLFKAQQQGPVQMFDCSTFCPTATSLNQKIDKLNQQRQALNDTNDELRLQLKQMEAKLDRAAEDFHKLKTMAHMMVGPVGAKEIENEAHDAMMRLSAVASVDAFPSPHDVEIPT